MTTLPSVWPGRRARFLFREVNDRGHQLPLASVTRDGGVEFRDDLRISVWNPGEDISSYKRVLPGDFVIGLRSFQSGLGFSPLEGMVSPAYTVLRQTSPDVHGQYFKHLFKSSAFISLLDNVAQGIRQGRTIAADDFSDLQLPTPPLPIQRMIGEYLDAETARIDALIAKKRRTIELLDQRWLEMLRSSVSPWEESPREHMRDDDWRVVRLRRLVDQVTGGSWGDEPGTIGIEHPCVRAADFDFPRLRVGGSPPIRSFSAEDVATRALQPGDLVIEKSGGGEDVPVGRVVQWTGPAVAVPTNFAARLRPSPMIDVRYLLYVFRAGYARGLNWKSIKQTTGIQNLDMHSYLSEVWAVPPLEVQAKIVKDLDRQLAARMQTTQLLIRQIELLTEHRRALITAAVTGEIDIPGAAA